MYHLPFHSGIEILLEKLATNIKNYLHEKFLLSLEPQKVYICYLPDGRSALEKYFVEVLSLLTFTSTISSNHERCLYNT